MTHTTPRPKKLRIRRFVDGIGMPHRRLSPLQVSVQARRSRFAVVYHRHLSAGHVAACIVTEKVEMDDEPVIAESNIHSHVSGLHRAFRFSNRGLTIFSCTGRPLWSRGADQ